ncbi:oxidoreductase [Advenella kashmirensis W13003]|uniref:Oxidoreductase n=2 Tax=Advenella kashmirensis TaxID=310575 RepID=V8QMM4_9BURK|nr:oxidoreductase [Advenella kashmirensis W13003]
MRKPKISVTEATIVITGATSGFGRGVALELARLGANVVLAARRTAALEGLKNEIIAGGGKAMVVTTDVSRPEDVATLARASIERFDHIDVWINNVGIGALGLFWDIPIEDHARVVDVNLKGLIYGAHEALRQFRIQGFGTLINMGSIDSEVPLAYQASYAASKAAVLSLSRSLNVELKLSGNVLAQT